MTTQQILDKRTDITKHHEFVQTPPGFKGIKLYPHQRTLVAALSNFENTRVITVSTQEFKHLTSAPIRVESSACVLSEKFGSGKTIILLAHILNQRIPKAFPTQTNSVLISFDSGRDYRRRYDRRDQETAFRHEVTRMFTGPDALIRANFIIVGSSVLVQWEEAITGLTDLKVLTVGKHHQLLKFQQLLQARKLNGYDIILVKNGNVTGNIPGFESEKDHQSMVTVVNNMLASHCVARAIYDDFDTIQIPSDACTLNALVTIYVSATTKDSSNMGKPSREYASLAEGFRMRTTPMNKATTDTVLFSNFNIRNDEAFTEESTRITIIDGFRYVYANPDDNYMRLLGAMGDKEANEIMEMLNGDAIGTAADALGIKTTSAADIFQRMLDKKYEKYLYDQEVLETIAQCRYAIAKLEPHHDNRQHTDSELNALRAIIEKKTIPRDEQWKYYSPMLDRLLDDMNVEFKLAKEHDGIAIHRVMDNIKEGECQVCRLPLKEYDTFIVRCCGLIVCDECGIKGNNFSIRYNYKLKSNTLMGSCANCKADLDPRQDLIFVDKKFDIETLLSAKGDEVAPEPAEPEPIVEATIDTNVPEIRNPKLKALLAICRGQKPEKRESISVNIPHLLKGMVDIPPDDSIERKVLVFASFTETLQMIEDFLVEHGITFLRLAGSYTEKAACVSKFRTYGTVLLVNSQQNCAGLNMEFCSDLVFFHKIMDENVSSQVAGRGQRLGRKCNMRLHFLCYNNERNV